ncbi:YedE family putative selenium transporter [Diplocloster agilis]|uniref:YedE-related selenium metabolism membrane protein n=1 Tax=Diplocloster agilis TaxID=2850323 RepID=A0A949K6Y5_9FIRM|nr:YedE family putative selenium transporter [Diplocloster agilis]MBU9738921.1 YedE-related selenium metabolism membrane protein [Diplocloster agilis]MBU9746825.1 YedE-related selenium metabolism membrane protein [Diplocloster agilis]
MNLTSSKKMLWASGAMLGGIAALLAYFGNPKNMAICVACFIRDTAGAMKFHQAEAVQYFRPEIVGFVAGAFLIALITKEYRSSAGSSPMIRFLLGVLMMIGSLVFLGCPLRMVIRMAAGDLNAYIALIGFVLGVATGSLALKKGFSLGRAYETKKSGGWVLPVILVGLLLLSVTTTLMASSESGPGSMRAPILLSLAGGLLFGAIAQKSRACFAGSVRDILLLKNFDLISVIGGFFVVMLIYNIATGGFHFSFSGQPVAHAQHIWNLLGMYVVGFAAVLAGGCPLRQLVLAGQGSSDSAITFLGMFVGAAVCHNFGLAAAAANAETNAPGGPAAAGKAAVLLCIVILLAIGFGIRKREDRQ